MTLEYFSKTDLERIAHEANQLQRIQEIVWDYMLLPKRERNSVEMAERIFNLFQKNE